MPGDDGESSPRWSLFDARYRPTSRWIEYHHNNATCRIYIGGPQEAIYYCRGDRRSLACIINDNKGDRGRVTNQAVMLTIASLR